MFSSNTSQVSADANWIEECFSTHLYTGNGSTQTITTGIDLAGKGGMLWIKSRSQATNHIINDTARGAGNNLMSNSTSAQFTNTDNVSALSSTGFSVGVDSNTNGTAGATYASWTFRKQPKFFDVVTYTGDGNYSTDTPSPYGRAISHSLGSTPGFIVIKATSTTSEWYVAARQDATYWRGSLGSGTDAFALNRTNSGILYDWATKPMGNATSFFPAQIGAGGSSGTTNDNGVTYVAYLFAHDAGGFGLTGTDNVISCGSWTGTPFNINLGWEPQWVLIKKTNDTGGWLMFDTMRGWDTSGVVGGTQLLQANTSGAEGATGLTTWQPNSTGFSGNANVSDTYIYIAIRRGPMKTPTTGTSVFDDLSRTGTGTVGSETVVGFPVDMVLNKRSSETATWVQLDRLRGNPLVLFPSATDAEFDLVSAGLPSTNGFTGPNQNSYYWPAGGSNYNGSGSSYASYFFRRAPGFFDVVCYTGTGSNTTQAHNLGVVPELMIVKRRSTTNAWAVYANNDNTDYLVLNTDAATADDNTYWNDTTPTSSVFSIGTNNAVNASGSTYVAYLFATVSGVSKVGSYTGSGTTKQIDCGFTGGARFVLIKRTDSSGDWYVWDSARGIVAGNDSYLVLNSTAAEVTNTDWVDTYSAGFELSNAAGNNVNINTATYIFLSVA